MRACPYDSRFSLCLPACAAAITKHCVSTALALSSSSQWASPEQHQQFLSEAPATMKAALLQARAFDLLLTSEEHQIKSEA